MTHLHEAQVESRGRMGLINGRVISLGRGKEAREVIFSCGRFLNVGTKWVPLGIAVASKVSPRGLLRSSFGSAGMVRSVVELRY